MLVRNGLVALLVVAALGACARDDAPATEAEGSDSTAAANVGSAPAAAVTKGDACNLVGAGDLKDVTGVEAEGQSSASGGADVCTWIGSNGKAVTLEVYPFASYYEDRKLAYEALYKSTSEPVADVGDEAFYIGGTTSGTPTANVSAKKGNSAISVQVMGSADGSDPRADALAFAKRVLEKM